MVYDKTADGDDFETLRALEQNLTFQYAEEIFEKNGIHFTEEKFYQLGIRNPGSELYTKLEVLLSDQCRHTIKAAVFSDEDYTMFQDKKEFSGSVFRQLEEAYEYLQLCNQNRMEISGLEREDHWDYPQPALREALLNAVIHRDYSYGGSIIINVNKKEIEFISIGGLLPGISKEDIQNGISLSRNPKLAEIFHRLRFIEAYGTGIRRIYSLYKNCGRKPEISVTNNSFRMVLPNMNESQKISEIKVPNTNEAVSIKISKQMQTVLEYLSEFEEATQEDIQELLDVKRTRAYVIMKELTEAGLTETTGRGKTKKYRITEAGRKQGKAFFS